MSGNRVPVTTTSRRELLSALAAGSGVSFGLAKRASGRAGESDEPLILTVAADGTPDRVRYVPAERKRRLKVFNGPKVDKLLMRNPAIHTARILQPTADPADLAIELQVATPETTGQAPTEIDGVPTRTKVRSVPQSEEYCRSKEQYSPIEGGIEIGVYGDTYKYAGTLGIVGYNANPDNPYKCILTAYHTVSQRADGKMYQPLDGEQVGLFDQKYEQEDAVKYESTVGGSAGGTIDSAQPDAAGWWTFDGLVDATADTGETVSVTESGIKLCVNDDQCYDAVKSTTGLAYRQARYVEDPGTSGDSGGPIVDGNKKMTGFISGSKPYDHPIYGDGRGLYGPVAGPVMSQLDVQLADPSNIQ